MDQTTPPYSFDKIRSVVADANNIGGHQYS